MIIALNLTNSLLCHCCLFRSLLYQIAYPDSKVHGANMGPIVGPMLAPWTLLSGYILIYHLQFCKEDITQFAYRLKLCLSHWPIDIPIYFPATYSPTDIPFYFPATYTNHMLWFVALSSQADDVRRGGWVPVMWGGGGWVLVVVVTPLKWGKGAAVGLVPASYLTQPSDPRVDVGTVCNRLVNRLILLKMWKSSMYPQFFTNLTKKSAFFYWC